MTNEEIEAFALQYPHIDCVKVEVTGGGRISKLLTPIEALKEIGINVKLDYIELRSIESLTDEEERFVMQNDDLGKIRDYLRMKGVAVSFRNFDVDEMIEQGVLKLKP